MTQEERIQKLDDLTKAVTNMRVMALAAKAALLVGNKKDYLDAIDVMEQDESVIVPHVGALADEAALIIDGAGKF